MVAHNEVPRRIRIKRIPTDPSKFRQLLGYIGYGNFSSFFIGDTIREKLRVKPMAALRVSYREDPFDSSNTELFIKYGFLDFTGIENEENTGLEDRMALLRGEDVSIIISPSETWILTLQERNTNLLQNSQNSETGYYFPRNHVLNINSEMYDPDSFEGFNNPFCNGEEQPSLGYRDQYEAWKFEE